MPSCRSSARQGNTLSVGWLAAALAMQLLSFSSARMLHQNSTAGASVQQASSSPKPAAAGDSLIDMSKNVFEFWLQHGPDSEHGGFHATLDRQGNPIGPTSKTIIQQARHLWAMSALQQSGRHPELSSAARAAAASLYHFITKHMLTTVNTGGAGSSGTLQAFVYEVSKEGTSVVNAAINVYGNAFAIYGLSKYAQASGSSEAGDLALAIFNTLEALYHNLTTGGYGETKTIGGLIFDSVQLPDGTKSQSFNTLLHVTEALAELSRATAGSNSAVQARLLEHVQLLTGKLVLQQNGQSFLAPNYNPKSWTVVGGDSISYGHNIEAAWLLADAVDELATRGTIDGTTASSMKSALQKIGQSAVQYAYDTTYSGFYEGGSSGQGLGSVPSNTNKVWWVQAEAMLGLDWLYRQTCQQQYRNQLQGVLGFIRQYMWDRQYGEWYWQVPRAGGEPLGYTTGGVQFNADVKGNWWKASYHTGRSLLLLQQLGY